MDYMVLNNTCSNKISLLLFLFLYSLLYANKSDTLSLSERDVVTSYLSKNDNVSIQRIQVESDLLELEKIKSLWLPNISLSSISEFVPHDSLMNSSFFNQSNRFNQGIGIKASQYIPGGCGIVSGEIGGAVNRYIEQDSLLYKPTLKLAYTLPLLRNAWKYSFPAYSLTITELNNNISKFSKKKDIIEQISAVRYKYWTLYYAIKMKELQKEMVLIAESRKKAELAKYVIGDVAYIDTLSSEITYLKYQKDFISSKSAVVLANEDLANELAINSTLILPDTTAEWSLSIPFSMVDSLIEESILFDLELKTYEILKQKYLKETEYITNSFLPSLDLSANYVRSEQVGVDWDNKSSFSETLGFSLVMTYDIPLNSKRMSRQIMEKKSEINDLQIKQRKLNIKAKVTDLHYSWKQEILSLTISQRKLNMSRQKFEAILQARKVGSATLLEVQSAEEEYLHASLSLLMQQLLIKKMEIVIDEITGNVIEKFRISVL